MAKTQATSTRSPLSLVPGVPVFFEDVREVQQMLSWSAGYRPQLHLSACVGKQGWSSNAVGTARCGFRSTATGYVEVLRWYIRVLPDVVTLTLGARCVFTAAETGDVRITIGASSAVLSFANADNGNEKTTTLATSSTGTGWLLCTAELDQTAGAGAANYLRDIRVEDVAITTIPAPVDE